MFIPSKWQNQYRPHNWQTRQDSEIDRPKGKGYQSNLWLPAVDGHCELGERIQIHIRSAYNGVRQVNNLPRT